MFYRRQQFNENNFNFNQQLPSQQPQYSSLSRNFIALDNKQKTFSSRGRTSAHNDDYENWKHFRAHRDRRDLYERLQNANPK